MLIKLTPKQLERLREALRKLESIRSCINDSCDAPTKQTLLEQRYFRELDRYLANPPAVSVYWQAIKEARKEIRAMMRDKDMQGVDFAIAAEDAGQAYVEDLCGKGGQ